MGIEIQKTNSHYVISFHYRPHLVEQIKRYIPKEKRKFDGKNKTWLVPLSESELVKNYARQTNAVWKGPEVVNSTAIIKEEDYSSGELPDLDIDIPLKMELFPYQKKGVAYILKQKRVIVGDKPGLGKTSQAIAAMEAAQPFPVLIICPSSLKINWQREIKMWTGKDAMIMEDCYKHNWHFYIQAGMYEYFIVNFESLKKYFVDSITTPKGQKMTLKDVKFRSTINLFKSIIIDEAHRVKSTATQQTKFTKGIAEGKEYRLALTGTPVINRPIDLVAQLGIIGRMPEICSYRQFMDRFCQGAKQASNLKELNQLLIKHCYYGRKKEEVLKDLPPKTRQIVLCDIVTRKEYNDALQSLENYLRQYKDATDAQIRKAMRGEIMVRIGILKNISARGKFPSLKEFIEDTIEGGEKLIVFAHLKEVIHQIKSEFKDAVTITGEDSAQERQASVDKFQNDPSCKLIICSIKAAGVGLTLTASSRVCFVELPWTFADCEQCEDRAHRIGQYDNVTCTYLLGANTIDQKIYSIIVDKKHIAATVTGQSDEVEESTVSQLIDLFNQEGI